MFSNKPFFLFLLLSSIGLAQSPPIVGGGVLSPSAAITGFSLAQNSANGSNGGAGTSEAVAYPSSIGSGHLLLAFANETNGGTTLTVADSKTNTWTALCPNGNSSCTGNANTDVNGCIHDTSSTNMGWWCGWWAVAGSSGADTVTVSSTTSGGQIGVVIQEWKHSAGIPGSPYDVSVVSNGNSAFNTTCTSGASGSVAGSTELLVGMGLQGAAVTWTPTGSLTTNDPNGKRANGSNQINAAYNLSSGTGTATYSFTMSGSSNWVCGGAAFKHN
jgi:hypothetical protein